MDVYRLRGIGCHGSGLADLFAEPAFRQPRTDEAVRGPSTLESKFPIMAVEHGCIVSKDADITVAFRVTLPEVFSVSSAEYEAMHAT